MPRPRADISSRPWPPRLKCACPPKSPLGSAIGYALNRWTPLTRFLDDEKLPPDNNASESALRVVALGRKNYLFVRNEDACNNVAGLYSLVATCEANGVNPLDYLSDVLLRVQDHPAAAIDDLYSHTAGVRAQPDPTSGAVRLPQLPRRQQDKIIEIVEAFVAQQERRAS